MDTSVNPQGWKAHLSLDYSHQGTKTRLSGRKQFGPLAVQRPFYPEGSVCHNYILHPPGGVVGGDQLLIDVKVQDKAHSLLTTPGATKFYRSAGALAQQNQQLHVADGGTLEFLPLENIYFPGANVKLHTQIELQGQAQFISWEIHCFGRPVIQEIFDSGQVHITSEVKCDDKLILIDQLKLDDENLLSGNAGLRNQPMFASLMAAPVNEDILQQVQTLILEQFASLPIGATLLDELLVVRMLGESTENIQQCFIEIWSLLRRQLLKQEPSPPRIWAT